MPIFTIPIHESNDCHNPEGPAGGQFCSTRGSNPALLSRPRPSHSKDLPDFLKADVLAALRAGVTVRHRQQPEPLRDIAGNITDPLAYSYAQKGEETWYDAKGFRHLAKRGLIQITTRGGEYEPTETVYGHGFSSTVRQKALKPEDLPESERATVDDIVSTFRHELGHIMDDKTWPGQGSGKIGISLAREVRAWTYAVEIAPDHRVSQRQVSKGLVSHAYSEFRKAAMLEDPETPWFKRQGYMDREEGLERAVQQEAKDGIVNIAAYRKATQFATRVMKTLDRYGAILRKKGFTRQPEPVPPNFLQDWYPKPKITPGPGRGGLRMI